MLEPYRCRKEFSQIKILFLTSLLSTSSAAYAAALGIGGGTDLSGEPYAILLTDLNGSLLPISGLPSINTSSISKVDINETGLSLIGGRDNSAAYASFITDDGTLLPISLSISTGEVFDLAINTSGLGLLGVHNFGLNDYYATYVTSDGDITPILIPEPDLLTLDLNDTGVGLIGGEGGGATPYASFITSDGTITPVTLSGIGLDIGHTTHVAINNSHSGIISAFTGSGIYAAFVYPDNSSLTLSSYPIGGDISGVAINDSGTGLIGGHDGSGNAYAGLVGLDGTVTSLISDTFTGNINSVALNPYGIGLIGGVNGSDLYAAIVQEGGSLLQLFSTPQNGFIQSVALNAQGVGFIGGQIDGTTAYAALVAPNGTLTPLTLSGSLISSVALTRTEGSIINEVVPTTLGPYSSIFYSQLAISKSLETRFFKHNRVWSKNRKASDENTTLNELSTAQLEANLAYSPAVHAIPRGSSSKVNHNSFWFEPFGNLLYLNKQSAIPQYSNQLAGGLIGYDWQRDNYLLGVSGGYAFNYVHISENQGHAKIQEEVFSLYGSWHAEHIWIALAISGGPYQTTNVRHFLHQFTSKGKFHGWVLDPHLEIASSWAIGQSQMYYIEPFTQLDWINNWQHHYSETGSTGFNLQVPHVYNSLLQSEVGLRFYEQFLYKWGKLCLEQKLSYINQAPFGARSQDVSFVSSAASFPVAVLSSKVQNLGSVQLLTCFIPQNSSLPYGGFSLEAAAGSSYQSYFGNAFIGIDF